jgi:hypothetical protein
MRLTSARHRPIARIGLSILAVASSSQVVLGGEDTPPELLIQGDETLVVLP